MITALDHVVLLCPDIEGAVADYTHLMGHGPGWESRGGGMASAEFRVGNTALELLAPDGEGEVAAKLRAMLAEDGPRLTSLAFASDDLAGDHHLFTRRGLAPGEITQSTATHEHTGEARTWQRFRCADAACAGIKTFILQRERAPAPAEGTRGTVTALDHLVINTPNPDRAVAQYGARLGLRFALDRTAEQWKTRFMFFRTGELSLEVIHRLDTAGEPGGDDSLWGLTWAVDDLEAAHARLSAGGVSVSDMRTGRKPGSQVFTVRNHSLGIPTLFIAHAPR